MSATDDPPAFAREKQNPFAIKMILKSIRVSVYAAKPIHKFYGNFLLLDFI